jgi:hypothetical protein
MNVKTFANYLLAILIVLLVLNYIVLYTMWTKYNTKGLLFALVLLSVVNIVTFIILSKVNVYDDKGKPQKLSDIFGDIIGVTIAVVIATILILITGFIIAYKSKNKIMYLVPIVSSALVFGSFAIGNAIKN